MRTFRTRGLPVLRSETVPTPPEVGTLSVSFFNQSATFERTWAGTRRHILDVVENGKYSHGAKVAELESALAGYTGARFVVGVNSGTDALVLLLRAAGLKPGEEVAVPAFSFGASATSVVLAGGTPVFADIEADGYGVDPAAVADAAGERTRFVMPTHLFSRLADIDGVLRVARRLDLTVVEDSAEAIGMRHRGTHAGLFGAGGVLSFFPTKTLGALGDAGAVLTDDARIAATADALRHHGRFGVTIADFPAISTATGLPGVNSKMDDIQAAVLLSKLTTLDSDIARRAELASRYSEALAGVAGVRKLPVHRPDSVFYVYVVEVDARDDLAAYLSAVGVETEIYYPTPLHLQPCFDGLGYRQGEFPNAERACRHTLALPLYPDMPAGDCYRVCDAIRDFYHGRRG
ncbi:DegT/DnrJ/EryC1/StrS family aminotransferase [Amycolatopsis japonica]|uniref:DegT/DnrJ/EryC1/StrS family aminotransferase n=1 Tax=Amycolatopsis japonica TaxID=208439 RepID=UPI003F4D3127